MGDLFSYQITIVAILLLFGVFSSCISSRFNIPVLLLFLGAGILLGEYRNDGLVLANDPTVGIANTIGTIAMAFILYSGGMETNIRNIKKIFVPGLLLSTLGVFVTASTLAVAVHFMVGWSWAWSLLLGAVVSSTDAAAVFSILRSRSVALHGDLAPVLEFESGSNDPMAALLTVFMVSFIKNPADTPWWQLLWVFPIRMSVGALAGFLTGKLGCYLFNKLKLAYEGLYFVLGIAVVLLAYGASESLYGNGFMAVYCAGLTMGNKRFNYRNASIKFHNGLAWLMQVAMFTVLGMLVTFSDLVDIPSSGIQAAVWVRGLLLAAALMFVARPLAVFLVLIKSKFSIRERMLISWVGLRGAAPIVLATFPLAAALSGNSDIDETPTMLFNLVFFMVIASVVIQGRTLMPFARLLKLDRPCKDKNRMPLELEETGVMQSVMHEFDISPASRCIGKTLAELKLPSTVRVMLIRRNDSFIMAGGDTKLEQHDGVLIMGEKTLLKKIASEYFPDNEFI